MDTTKLCAAAALLALPVVVSAQAGGFVTRLGADTTSVERYVRSADKIEGTIVSRSPVTSLTKFTLWIAKDGSISALELAQLQPNGTPAQNANTGMKMTVIGDSVIREMISPAGVASSRHTAVPKGTLPAIGNSLVYYQFVLAQARRAAEVNVIGFGANNSATKLNVRIISADSAEVVNQGFRTGYKTDKDGHVLRSDGSLTTQKFVGTAVKDVDAAAIATAWSLKDAAGQKMGAASTRDTAKAVIGGASLMVDYGRPAMRGREIWGKLVPFDTVWRFGANWAAQFKTDKNLEIGGTAIPAGTYTIWLLPSAKQTLLIVNRLTMSPPPPVPSGQPAPAPRALWGTEYDAAFDVARIPMQKRSFKDSAERFTTSFSTDDLVLQWDKAGYAVKIKAK